MGFREQVEKSAGLVVMTAVVAGFAAGYGAYEGIIRARHMEVIPQEQVQKLRDNSALLKKQERELDLLKQKLAQYSTRPRALKEIQEAELRLSDVDDLLRVKINGQGDFFTGFGETIPPFQIKSLLRKGPNEFDIRVENNGGPCSGTVTVLLDGDVAETWSVRKSGEQGNPCFEQSRFLELR